MKTGGNINDINVLSSSNKYICWVALGNCFDYFVEVNLIGKNKQPIIRKGNELKVFRLFLNAVESLNNIVDYLYFDKFHNQFKSFERYKKELLNKHSILYKINEIANAYKHCKRGKDRNGLFCVDINRLHAKDIRLDNQILIKAFKFWAEYHQKDGNINLFNDT